MFLWPRCKGFTCKKPPDLHGSVEGCRDYAGNLVLHSSFPPSIRPCPPIVTICGLTDIQHWRGYFLKVLDRAPFHTASRNYSGIEGMPHGTGL